MWIFSYDKKEYLKPKSSVKPDSEERETFPQVTAMVKGRFKHRDEHKRQTVTREATPAVAGNVSTRHAKRRGKHNALLGTDHVPKGPLFHK